MIINYGYYWEGAGRQNKVKRCGEKEERKEALSGERFIYYNNSHRVTCNTPSGRNLATLRDYKNQNTTNQQNKLSRGD